MKQIFSVNNSSTKTDLAILLCRLVIAALMLTHGIPKMLSLFSGEVQFPPLFGLSATASLSLAVFAEVFCSLLILFGLGTRLAAIPLIMTMLVAVLLIHAADPFEKQELGLLYLLPFVMLFITGSGKYSIDYLLQKRSWQAPYSPTKF